MTNPPDSSQYEEATQHYSSIRAFLVGQVEDREDGEDLTQQVFEVAIEHWDEYEEGTDCLAWLFRIARKRLASYFSGEDREVSADFRDGTAWRIDSERGQFSSKPDPEDHPQSLESFANEYGADPVLEAVQELPEAQRAPIMLSMVQGYKYREIADRLQISIGTVMSRIHRARQKLQDALASYAEQEGYV